MRSLTEEWLDCCTLCVVYRGVVEIVVLYTKFDGGVVEIVLYA